MDYLKKSRILNLDIYARRIGFFYKNSERISKKTPSIVLQKEIQEEEQYLDQQVIMLFLDS